MSRCLGVTLFLIYFFNFFWREGALRSSHKLKEEPEYTNAFKKTLKNYLFSRLFCNESTKQVDRWISSYVAEPQRRPSPNNSIFQNNTSTKFSTPVFRILNKSVSRLPCWIDGEDSLDVLDEVCVLLTLGVLTIRV